MEPPLDRPLTRRGLPFAFRLRETEPRVRGTHRELPQKLDPALLLQERLAARD